MKIFSKKTDLIVYLATPEKNKKIGFVPTMGAIHDGHLSLLKTSIQENDTTVISIFVNPTQFNNLVDLEKYPRNLEADIKKIETLSDKIIVYAPDVFDVYGENTTVETFDFDGLEHQMEGKFRPGHFNGVGTVVRKLFEIVKPTNAYFGEKDFQQLQIIRKLIEKLNLNINIVEVPIFRENSGLAMSSRNERLDKNEKLAANKIFETLKVAKLLFKENTASYVKKMVKDYIKEHTNYKLDYVEIADEKTLLPCKRKNKKTKYRIFIAVFVQDVRLIDTMNVQ